MVFQPHSNRVFYDRLHRDPETNCWIYDGPKILGQYGSFKRERAHRFAYTHFTGQEIPEGKVLRHTCDNPACCNPLHLILGTQADNIQDTVDRGRQHRPTGSRNPKAKLTEDQVREIRQDPRSGYALARIYSCSQVNISDIRRRKTWAHLSD